MNEATEENRCQSGLSGGNHKDQSFWGGKQKGTLENTSVVVWLYITCSTLCGHSSIPNGSAYPSKPMDVCHGIVVPEKVSVDGNPMPGRKAWSSFCQTNESLFV